MPSKIISDIHSVCNQFFSLSRYLHFNYIDLRPLRTALPNWHGNGRVQFFDIPPAISKLIH